MTSDPEVFARNDDAGGALTRLAQIDALRGLAMIVMALDHVRDFIHRGAMSASPTDLQTTTPLLFATRWVTHFCAPTFALTAGIGAYLWWRQGCHSRRQLSGFLVTRGLWLMVLELVVMRLAYYFSWSPQSPILLLVLWSLGLAMIALALVIWLPQALLGPAAVLILMLHPLLGAAKVVAPGASALVTLLTGVGAFKVLGVDVIAPYPLAPWLAIMLLGFSLGPLFAGPRDRRVGWLLALGAAALALFVGLRALNGYGDPVAWSRQGAPLLTVLSFINVTKYPASPDFALLTLGVILIGLAGLDRVLASARHQLSIPITLGRTPLFYYLTHFFIAHLIATLLALATYGSRAFGFVFGPYPSMGGARAAFPPGFGFELWVVYAVWLAVLVLCYPLCRRYAAFKARRRSWWLAYL